MFVLQETVQTGVVAGAGWAVLLASLAITAAWLAYLYR
jgi:hypothetical protein